MLAVCFPSLASSADSVCSRVSIEIMQEMTLERIAFDAKMVITNNMPDKDLEEIRVDLIIKDTDGNIKDELFFIKVSSTQGITALNGTGIVKSGTKGEAHWLIIPSPGAGGETPEGKAYMVGATLSYSVSGNQEIVNVNPDTITVKPEAQLILDYLLPYEVIGDNPFTPRVEPPVPFPLAVRVFNNGFGTARNLKIDSAQPKIVANEQGLLINFSILGTAVNDSYVDPSLTVNIGDLPSKAASSAYWEMISTLSGEFVEFDVSFSHSSDLGGELTSILQATNSYYLVHRVRANLPGRDLRLDFLVDRDKDANHLPDSLLESEVPGNGTGYEDSIAPVNIPEIVALPSRPTSSNPNVQLELNTGEAGWIYARFTDPAQGMFKLLDVARKDGVHLDPNNFWVDEMLDSNYKSEFTAHILDYRAGADTTGIYTLVYEKPAEDNIPPGTALFFSGPSKGTEPVYISPETEIVFTAKDNEGGSGVEQVLKKLSTDTDFSPAYPMKLSEPGAKTLDYYSIDRAGNKEPVKLTALYVDREAPEIISFTAAPASISPHAPAGVKTARSVLFEITARDESGSIHGKIRIARGATFSEGAVVKEIELELVSDIQAKASWNGKDKTDSYLPSGVYTARLVLTDGLDGAQTSHTTEAEAQISIADWFNAKALDPNLSGAQQYPEISGTRVVWQDKRNGNWDIYLKEIDADNSVRLTDNSADQVRPAIYGDIVLWQDYRNGNWDIYGFDLAQNKEIVICTDAGNQEKPVISGEWVSWQDDRYGNKDIFLSNISTGEKRMITSHERDQINPSISGGLLVWEDYRHGLGEIYEYDLGTRSEARLTYNVFNQTQPSISGQEVAWTDNRNGQRDIFALQAGSEARITYGTGDHSQAYIRDKLIIYTDYETGLEDPNLAFYDLNFGTGGILSADPSRQEEPASGPGFVAWQDDRDGIYQIYWGEFEVEPVPVEINLKTGFNLIAVGDMLLGTYPGSSSLIASGLGIEELVAFSGIDQVFLLSSPQSDITLKKGMGIGVYAASDLVLEVAASGENTDYTLYQGLNYIGILSAPIGYRSHDLMRSVCLENIQSVRRFNNKTGAWETSAVRETGTGLEIVGPDFPIFSGEGLAITMKNRVDGWRP